MPIRKSARDWAVSRFQVLRATSQADPFIKQTQISLKNALTLPTTIPSPIIKMRFSTRAKINKSVNAKGRPGTSVASIRSKNITKKPHKKLPAGDEDTSEEGFLPTTIPSPRIKIKRKFNKKSKTWSAISNTAPETSIASTKSKILAKAHKKKSLKEVEEASEASETRKKVTLRDCDVLLGRGNGIASWVGNKAFRSLVFSYKAAYQKAYRCEKSLVSKQVIEDVHEGGGRFVERNGFGGHVEVTYEKALEKTCQCLREKPFGENVAEVDDEEIPEPSTSSSSAAKRKGTCSPSRPSKKAKKARADDATKVTKATKILPSVTASMMTFKNKNGPKKEPRGPKITLKKKPSKKELRVPRKVVKKITSSNVAAGAAEACPTFTSSGITANVKRAESEDNCRVQKLVDQAVKIKMMSHHGDLDDIFVLAPPNLTTFFSGIVSLSERSIHAVTGKGHPGADLLTLTPASKPTRGKSLTVLKQAREKHTRDTLNPESPTNVTDFDRVMLEAIFEPAFEPNQSSDFALDLLEDSSANHWPSHGYMG
jgi:hypothetical protein